MLTTLAISNYRSLLHLVMPLGRLNVITGPNASGKSNLYRALRLLAETARGGLVPALAMEGGLDSTLWAGPETISRSMRSYTNSLGGTSSACPGVAGTAALILAHNPALRWDQVKDIFKQTGDPIDVANGNYDPVTKHSPLYGYGRVNAGNAVAAAITDVGNGVVRTIRPQIPIRDNASINAVLSVPDTAVVSAIKAIVDIEHTWVGDLTIRLQPPAALGVGPILLHAREGGSADNLRRTYDVVSTPALAAILGKAISGDWTLTVADEAAEDEGVLHAFSLDIAF